MIERVIKESFATICILWGVIDLLTFKNEMALLLLSAALLLHTWEKPSE